MNDAEVSDRPHVLAYVPPHVVHALNLGETRIRRVD